MGPTACRKRVTFLKVSLSTVLLLVLSYKAQARTLPSRKLACMRDHTAMRLEIDLHLCLPASMKLLLDYLKLLGLSSDDLSVLLMFLVISSSPFFYVSVTLPLSIQGPQVAHFPLPLAASSYASLTLGPIRLLPGGVSVPFTLLYIASLYFTASLFWLIFPISFIISTWYQTYWDGLQRSMFHTLSSMPSFTILCLPEHHEGPQQTPPVEIDLEYQQGDASSWNPSNVDLRRFRLHQESDFNCSTAN